MDGDGDQCQASSSGNLNVQDSPSAVGEVDSKTRILTPLNSRNFQRWQNVITFEHRVGNIWKIIHASHPTWDTDDIPEDQRQALVNQSSRIELFLLDVAFNPIQYFNDIDGVCKEIIEELAEERQGPDEVDGDIDQGQASPCGNLNLQQSLSTVGAVDSKTRIPTPMESSNIQMWQYAISLKHRVDSISQIIHATYSTWDTDSVPEDRRQAVVDKASEIELKIFDKSTNPIEYHNDVNEFCKRLTQGRAEERQRADEDGDSDQGQASSCGNLNQQQSLSAVGAVESKTRILTPMESSNIQKWQNAISLKHRVDEIWQIICASHSTWDTDKMPEGQRQAVVDKASQIELRIFDKSTSLVEYLNNVKEFCKRLTQGQAVERQRADEDNIDHSTAALFGKLSLQDSPSAVGEVHSKTIILTPRKSEIWQSWHLAISCKQRVENIWQIIRASYSTWDTDVIPEDQRQTLVHRASEIELRIFDRSTTFSGLTHPDTSLLRPQLVMEYEWQEKVTVTDGPVDVTWSAHHASKMRGKPFEIQYIDDVDGLCEKVIQGRAEQRQRAEEAIQQQEVVSVKPGAQNSPQTVPQTCRWKGKIKPLPVDIHRYWHNNFPTELRVDNIYGLIKASFPRWETCPIPEERRQSLTQTALEMEHRGFEESSTLLQYFDYMAMYVIRISMKV